MRLRLLLAIASSTFLAWCASAAPASSIDAPVSPGAMPQVYALLNYLNSVKGSAIISGQHAGLSWFGTPPLTEVNYLYNQTGKKPAILGLDFIFLNDPNDIDWNTREPLQQIPRDAINWAAQGGIVTINWHWKLGTYPDLFNFYVTTDDDNDWRTPSVPATDWDLAKGLTPGTPENVKFNADMDLIANELKKIQDAGVPILWRPFHECSGNWFWWSAHYDPVTKQVVKHPELFKQAWRSMFDRFTRIHQLRNLIWVYNPNADLGDVANWYPGDEYVDMISVDTYPPNGTHPTLASTYKIFHDFTNGRKVVAMTENGAIPDPDNLFSEGAEWSFFATWNGGFITDATANGELPDSTSIANNLDFLKKVYTHPKVITLDELPDLYGPADNRLVNLSTRGPVGLTDQPMIGGFVIKGSQHKRVLLRAAGPALSYFGVPNTLTDPLLELYDGNNNKIAENDNWGSSPETALMLSEAFTQTGAFDSLSLNGSTVDTWPASSKDAALLIILPPGNYTAQIKSKTSGQTGTALIEIYDADLASAGSSLVNLSTLCDVASPGAEPVAGFIMKGPARRILLRGAGPALTDFGVPSPVSDPALLLEEAGSGTFLSFNDDWLGSTALNEAFTATGAFDELTILGLLRDTWSAQSKDSALIYTLVPNAQGSAAATATLSNAEKPTGRALLELYDYP